MNILNFLLAAFSKREKMNPKEIFELLKKGTEQILPEVDFLKKIATGKKLKIKLGVDPTASDLHLGHAVVLSKLKQFQDLGHEVIYLIGDFTSRIGDPTGRSKTRPPLTEEQIAENAKTYFEQVSKILDKSKITIAYNSQWLDALTIKDFVRLCGKVTVARIIEREDFSKRLHEKLPIGFHELLYPLFQGYDSVALQADVELGGTDQTFNLMVGRDLQDQYGQEPQVVMTLPLLPGLDGVQKMSKSLGNYVGLNDAPDQAYGKLMSISDDLMWQYYKILLYKTEHEIQEFQLEIRANRVHPMDLKKKMAYDIIAKFWSLENAKEAQQLFEDLFQKKDLSHAQKVDCSQYVNKPVWIVELLKHVGSVSSSSEARRLITEGAVSLDGTKITDINANVELKQNQHLKVGKHRFYTIDFST